MASGAMDNLCAAMNHGSIKQWDEPESTRAWDMILESGIDEEVSGM